MGLDMYFYLEDKESREIIEYSYYRKFNALQGYFVNHFDIQNCRRVHITKEVIRNLYKLLNDVKHSPEKADQLLPTYPGPFFGSYEYGRIYHNYVHEAARDMYHAQFINFNKYNLYFTSDW